MGSRTLRNSSHLTLGSLALFKGFYSRVLFVGAYLQETLSDSIVKEAHKGIRLLEHPYVGSEYPFRHATKDVASQPSPDRSLASRPNEEIPRDRDEVGTTWTANECHAVTHAA